MNFQTFKITEQQNNFYLYYVSLFDDPELTMETVEHFVSNSPQIPMCQYLMTCDFDEVTCVKVPISPIDVINRNLPSDEKCMNTSQAFISLIPPPKQKRVAKPKAESSTPKPRGKRSTKKVEISTEKTTIDMN